MSAIVSKPQVLATYTLNLIFVESWDLVRDHPGNAAAEVDELVHYKGHDAGCEHIVLHVGIPCCPGLLCDVEVDVVCGDVIKIVGVGDRGQGGEDS